VLASSAANSEAMAKAPGSSEAPLNLEPEDTSLIALTIPGRELSVLPTACDIPPVEMTIVPYLGATGQNGVFSEPKTAGTSQQIFPSIDHLAFKI
jgi:hypothetical protein